MHWCAQVKDTRDVENFARMLRGLVRGHDNTIHMLQAGALWITFRSFETISVFVVFVRYLYFCLAHFMTTRATQGRLC